MWGGNPSQSPQLEFCFNEPTCLDSVLVTATMAHAQCSLPAHGGSGESCRQKQLAKPSFSETVSYMHTSHLHTYLSGCPSEYQQLQLCRRRKSGRSAFLPPPMASLAKLKGHNLFRSNFPSWCPAPYITGAMKQGGAKPGSQGNVFLFPTKSGGGCHSHVSVSIFPKTVTQGV